MKIAFRAEGRVQGVGYRIFVRQQARALDLAGWVHNDLNGTVSGEASGLEASLTAFRDALLKGSAWAKVTALDWQALDEGESPPQPFEIRP